MTSRPVALDLREDEQPVQASQGPALRLLSDPPRQQQQRLHRQAQAVTPLPQAVPHRPEPALQGSVSAPQRHPGRPQRLRRGPEQEQPEGKQQQPEQQQQHVAGEAFSPLPPLPLRPGLSPADVDEGGGAPPGHLPGTASLVDPPLSAADSPTQPVAAFSRLQHCRQTAPAGDRVLSSGPLPGHRALQREPVLPPLPYVRAKHREPDRPIDLSLAHSVRRRERNGRSSRQRSQSSSNGSCPKSSRKSQTSVENSPGCATRTESWRGFKENPESLAGEYTSSERESENICAEESSGPSGQNLPETAAVQGSKASGEEVPDAPETTCTARSQKERRRLRPSTSTVSPERHEERARSPIHASFAAPDQTEGPSLARTSSPATKRNRQSSASSDTRRSPRSRSRRQNQDTGSWLTGPALSSDVEKARCCAKSFRAETREETDQRGSSARNQQQLQGREVPHAVHAQVSPASHQQKQERPQSPHLPPHCPSLPPTTPLIPPPTFHSSPARASERAFVTWPGPERTGRNTHVGSDRQSKIRNLGENAEGDEDVSLNLTAALTKLSKPESPCPPNSQGPESWRTTPQPEGAGVSTESDQHHSTGSVQVKTEAVDEDYPPGNSQDIQDMAKTEHVVNTARSDHGKQVTCSEGQNHQTESLPSRSNTATQWSIVYETPVSRSAPASSPFPTDTETKEEIDKEMVKRLYNGDTDKDAKKEIDKETEIYPLLKNVKEDRDRDTKDSIEKDTKEHINRNRLQETSNSAPDWTEHWTERKSSGSELPKELKNEVDEEVKKEKEGDDSLTEVTPTFLDSSLQTAQPPTLPHGDGLRTSRNQQRRKQKTPRQIRKQSVLQTRQLSKNEDTQTDGDGDRIMQEVAEYLSLQKKNCHPHYQPGCKLYTSQGCVDVPTHKQSLPLSQTDPQNQQSKLLTPAGMTKARTFPETISGGDNLLNLKGFQILGNYARGLNMSPHTSLAESVSSHQSSSLASTTSANSKVCGTQPADDRNQMLRLNRVDFVPSQTYPPKGTVTTEHSSWSSPQTAPKTSSVLSTPAAPFSLVRLPCIPVPVHCPAMLQSVAKHQVHPSTPLPLVPTAGLANAPKTAAQHPPSYIPIVPKMSSSVVTAVPTKLSVSGISPTVGTVAKGEACSGSHQSVHNAFTPISGGLSTLIMQQHGEGSVVQAVPQFGIVRSQVVAPCAGGIPLLLFLPGLGHSVLAAPVKTDTVTTPEFTTTAAASAKTSSDHQGPESTNVTGEQVSVKDNTDFCADARNSDDHKQENFRQKVANPTKTKFSKGESQMRANLSSSSEADSAKEMYSKTTEGSENLASKTLTSSSENMTSRSAKTSPSENRTQAVSTVTPGQGISVQSTTEHSVTSSFPFHYDACKRAEEIVFSTKSAFPLQRDAQHAWKQSTDATCTRLPCPKDNSQTSIKKWSTETFKSTSMSKSGRKRIASTRYDFHSDIELSDASEKEDISPVTSDDEWIPEQDGDGQTSPSSEEEEDGHTKLRKRDSLVDLLYQARKKRFRKPGHGAEVKKPRAEPAPCYNLSINFLSREQPQQTQSISQQTQISTKPETPEKELTKMTPQQIPPVEHQLDKTSLEPKSDPKEESGLGNSAETTPVPNPTPTSTPILKKRRRTPYTKEELTCRMCSKTFINIYRLRRHEFSHGDERPYVCDQCGKAFKQSGHRNEHRLTHNVNKRSFLCNECGVVISSRSSFRYHLLSHKQVVAGSISTAGCEVTTTTTPGEGSGSQSSGSGSEPHPGPTPGTPEPAATGLQGMLESQLRSCVAAAYDCPHCILRFATAQSLNCHLESHKEVELRCHVQPFTCAECGRSFTYRHNLDKHRECHLKPEKRADSYQRQVQAAIAAGKPHFVCDTCGKVYLRKETLTKHLKTHLGLKPFQCAECHKSFTQKIHLTVHSRLHTGSRPFQCRTCRCCFLDSTALARHVMRDVCRSEGFTFNVGKRGRKPFHMVMDEKVKAIVKSNRERRQRKGPASLRCGLCSWTGRYEGFLRRHAQRRHPAHVHKALKDAMKPPPTQKHHDVIMTDSSVTSSAASAPTEEEDDQTPNLPNTPPPPTRHLRPGKDGTTRADPQNLSVH